ncbi:hypothetical protein GGR50DRAFT_690846 [Xylaria sp. CBS 124048]|nr:hypothetical protein GGR50DRAFT_690846 [Xylaria sp. CBS 124048]
MAKPDRHPSVVTAPPRVAEDAEIPKITMREVEIFNEAMRCVKYYAEDGEPIIDYVKLAEKAGFANVPSSSSAWSKVKKKFGHISDLSDKLRNPPSAGTSGQEPSASAIDNGEEELPVPEAADTDTDTPEPGPSRRKSARLIQKFAEMDVEDKDQHGDNAAGDQGRAGSRQRREAPVASSSNMNGNASSANTAVTKKGALAHQHAEAPVASSSNMNGNANDTNGNTAMAKKGATARKRKAGGRVSSAAMPADRHQNAEASGSQSVENRVNQDNEGEGQALSASEDPAQRQARKKRGKRAAKNAATNQRAGVDADADEAGRQDGQGPGLGPVAPQNMLANQPNQPNRPNQNNAGLGMLNAPGFDEEHEYAPEAPYHVSRLEPVAVNGNMFDAMARGRQYHPDLLNRPAPAIPQAQIPFEDLLDPNPDPASLAANLAAGMTMQQARVEAMQLPFGLRGNANPVMPNENPPEAGAVSPGHWGPEGLDADRSAVLENMGYQDDGNQEHLLDELWNMFMVPLGPHNATDPSWDEVNEEIENADWNALGSRDGNNQDM